MRVLRKTALLWGVLLLAACTVASQPSPTATLPPSPTTTPLPPTLTATATPAPPTVVLLGKAGSYPEGSAAVRRWVEALARAQGYALIAVPPGKPLPPHTVLAVGVGVVPPVAEGARRIVVAPPDAADLQGAQVLDPTSADGPRRAFLAGYLAVLVTKDWRAGFLGAEDEDALATAFEDGGRYFCGLCRPLLPPFLAYPQYALTPPDAPQEAWQAAAGRLLQAGVQTVALSPAALAHGMDASLAAQGARLIALTAVPAEAEGRFIAAIIPDVQAGLDVLWQNAGQTRAGVPLRVAVFDATVITPGRQARVAEIQSLLMQGLIAP